jgi:glycosyltransferase EpsE
MTSNVKISVLMGIYNCAGTLVEAVTCVINQTYADWELILCDDGSTDHTYEVAKELAQTDKRILLIRNDYNMGLAATLNHCLTYAKGEFVARMDGDDVCDLNRFRKELTLFKKYPDIAVVSTGMTVFDESGVYGKALFPERPSIYSIFKSTPFCHAAMMMKTTILEELNGYRDVKEVERIEDYDLWVRLYQAGYSGYNIQEYLYSMRDDRAALKRKKLAFRMNEYKLKLRICRLFNLSLRYKILSIKPILIGLLPAFIYTFLHKLRLR